VSIDLLRPAYLLLLLLVPLFWFLPRRAERRTHVLIRSLVLALIALALAGPVLVTPESATYRVLVLDQSASVGGAQREEARRLAEQWQSEVSEPRRASVILVGSPAPGDFAPREDLGSVLRVQDEVSGSPLGAALAAAERQIPSGATGVVTLVTDGLATDRRWGSAVQQLTTRGIPVAVHQLGFDTADLRPVSLTTDPVLRVGQTARVAVDVLGDAGEFAVRLVDAAGRELARSPTRQAQGRTAVALEFEPAESGVIEIAAEILPAQRDRNPANNRLERTVAVQPPLRVLYLGDRVQGGAARLAELLGRGFEVQDGSSSLDPGTALPAADLVFVDDRPSRLLPDEFQRRLADAVRHDGLGLVFSGGRASFGSGGFHQTPIAEVLPVEFIQRAEKQDPSTALAVIIDTSGSMMGSRIELAKQVTRLAVRRLKAHDRVGIVEFYGNKHWALPLQSAANKIAIDRAIGRMQATGGTVMYPAIEEAYYGLKNVNTRYKHILIITDAGVEDADYESLLRLIAKDNINVSTVLVGSQAHSQSLIDIANWGRGRFYAASDRYALPEPVLKQAATMTLPAYKTGSFAPEGRGARNWWSDISPDSIPPLSGYVETQSRPGAEVVLEVEGNAHPVLASWHFGLGRVTVLTTEPLGEGTANWRDWPDYGRWLARIASRTAGDLSPFRFTVERRDHELLVHARRYGDRAGLLPSASLAAGTRTTNLEFRQLTPDHFVATAIVSPRDAARISAKAATASGVTVGSPVLLASDAAADVMAELQVDPDASIDLARLAEATGGVFAEAGAATPLAAVESRSAAATSLSLVELWPYATLAALLLYLGELAYRRWPRSAPLSA
jgi:Ca-activated chloride channel homolog